MKKRVRKTDSFFIAKESIMTKENNLKKFFSLKNVPFYALICSVLWGSAFSGVKIGYAQFGIKSQDSFSQMIFAGSRFAIAGIMAIAIGSIMQKKILLPTKKALPKIGVISLFQTILQYVFYYIGLAHTTGVRAAINVSMNVFMALFISALIFKFEKITSKKMVGTLLGFGGILIINSSGLSGNFNFIGDGFILLSSVANGFSSAFMKKYSKDENPVMLTGWQFLFGGIVMCIAGIIGGGKLNVINAKGIAILFYLAFVSAVAYSLWSALLKYNPVSKVSVWGFMNPICGVILSTIFLGEKGAFGLKGLVSLLFVSAGIFVVNMKTKVDNKK